MHVRVYLALTVILIGFVIPTAVFAEPSVTLDKSSYKYGESIKVSGKVQYESGMFVLIQLRSPSDIVGLNQITPSKSGSFSATFEAEGPKWQQPGQYTVMVSFMGQTAEKTFQFTIPEPQEPVKPAQPATVPPEEEPTQEQPKTEKPKITIKGFPDPSKSPQYYYDRYENEPEFRQWFDSTFAGYAIQEIVGYKKTHVSSFPDSIYSPEYYIDRYENEDPFRDWFDAQFPGRTIYDVVGVPEEVKAVVPDWVRQYARWWSEGSIDDGQFAGRISELIRQNVIVVDESLTITNNEDRTIPAWFKNNALWYSQGYITEEDFMSGIQYLIEQQVIIV